MNNAHHKSKQTRELLLVLLTLATLTAIIIRSWGLFPEQSANEVAKDFAAQESIQSESLDEKLFNIQAKFVVGAVSYFNSSAPSANQLEHFVKSFEEQFLNVGLNQNPLRDIRLLQKQLILSIFLDLDSLAINITNILSEDTSGSTSELSNLLVKASRSIFENSNSEDSSPLLDAELSHISNSLGWFGELLIVKLKESEESQPATTSASIIEAQKAFESLLQTISIVTILLILSAVFLVIYSYLLSKGKIASSFKMSSVPSYLLLEVFLLYLLAMNFLPELSQFLFSAEQRSNQILLNIIIISGLLVVILWPKLFGVALSDILATIGFKIFPVKQFFLAIFHGISGYVLSVAPLILLLLVYSTLLSFFEVNPIQGAHPIVPIMLSEKSQTSHFQILILAVVVAPIVEEIMFRGVLFSWLRLRLGAVSTIFISALIFAAIHPQGALGLLPLGFIGLVLGILREWRNSIIVPMVTHACFNLGTLLLVSTLLQ